MGPQPVWLNSRVLLRLVWPWAPYVCLQAAQAEYRLLACPSLPHGGHYLPKQLLCSLAGSYV
jgi:hypothetical protein